jgi:hypothetical protein
MRALNEIAKIPAGAQSLVDADVFDSLPELVKSPSPGVRRSAAKLLGSLGIHDFRLALLVNSNLFVSLLRRVRLPILGSASDDVAAMAIPMSS